MSAPTPLPVIALVGRPNVGKSTLFNRILGQRQAVVHPTPGVTRDRNYGQAEHKRRRFFLVDTGGFEPETNDRLLIQMREQTLLAVEEADAIIFLADVLEPDNPADDEIIHTLRRSGKPIFLAINKCDSQRREEEANFFTRFGFDRIYPVSALHGRGILDLLDDIVDALPDTSLTAADTPEATRIAIVGRQNAGKSTLLNRLLGEERVIANPTPGTTRDSIDTYIERDGKMYCLVDTAGIRRRGRVERGIEHLSVMAAVMAIQRCDVVILVIDAKRGIDQQDTHIGGAIKDNWRPCILALNKWDTLEKDNSTYGAFIKKTQEAFNFLPHAKIEAVSALAGQRCQKLWALIDDCVEQARRKVPTADLNRVIQTATEMVTPPARGGRNLKIKYATQVASNPPTFVLFVNDPTLIHFSYERYLLNRIRAAFDFKGTPIRIIFRRKSPPQGWEEYVKIREGLRKQKGVRADADNKPKPKWREEEEMEGHRVAGGAIEYELGEEWEAEDDDVVIADWGEEDVELESDLETGDESESDGDGDEGEDDANVVELHDSGKPGENYIEDFIDGAFDEDDEGRAVAAPKRSSAAGKPAAGEIPPAKSGPAKASTARKSAGKKTTGKASTGKPAARGKSSSGKPSPGKSPSGKPVRGKSIKSSARKGDAAQGARKSAKPPAKRGRAKS